MATSIEFTFRLVFHIYIGFPYLIMKFFVYLLLSVAGCIKISLVESRSSYGFVGFRMFLHDDQLPSSRSFTDMNAVKILVEKRRYTRNNIFQKLASNYSKIYSGKRSGGNAMSGICRTM